MVGPNKRVTKKSGPLPPVPPSVQRSKRRILDSQVDNEPKVTQKTIVESQSAVPSPESESDPNKFILQAMYVDFRSRCEKYALQGGVLTLGLYLAMLFPLLSYLIHDNPLVSPVLPLYLGPVSFILPSVFLFLWESGLSIEVIDNFLLKYIQSLREEVSGSPAEFNPFIEKEQEGGRIAVSQCLNCYDNEALVKELLKLRSEMRATMPSIESKESNKS